MTWNKAYTFNEDGSFTTYRLEFGRRVRSFATLAEAEAFLTTPEFKELYRVSQGYWLKEITEKVLRKQYER